MRIANPALEVPGLRPVLSLRHARRQAAAVLAVGAIALVLLRSMSAAVAGTPPGFPTCVVVEGASTADRLTGRVCPPDGFAEAIGYEPTLVHTPYGWRYTKPASAGGACSGPIREHGPFWDFGAACRMHDYGYDLVRFGVAERPEADRLLYRDMKASCLEIGLVERPVCKVLADTANAILTIGDATGFDVELLPPGAVA